MKRRIATKARERELRRERADEFKASIREQREAFRDATQACSCGAAAGPPVPGPRSPPGHGMTRRRRCGARTPKGPGKRCSRKPVAGRRRCRLHGGASTGPRTELGLLRLALSRMRHGAWMRAETWDRWMRLLRRPGEPDPPPDPPGRLLPLHLMSPARLEYELRHARFRLAMLVGFEERTGELDSVRFLPASLYLLDRIRLCALALHDVRRLEAAGVPWNVAELPRRRRPARADEDVSASAASLVSSEIAEDVG